MSNPQILSDELKSVYADKKTGKLFVFAKQANSTKLGTILVADGEIVGIEYCGEHNDEALQLLLSSQITQVIFVAVPVPESDRSANLVGMASVLERIEGNADTTRRSDTEIAEDLRSEALKMLDGLFGAASSKKIDRIAAKYPPSERPLEFLAACHKIIESVFGKAVAERTLAHLHRRLKEDELR